MRQFRRFLLAHTKREEGREGGEGPFLLMLAWKKKTERKGSFFRLIVLSASAGMGVRGRGGGLDCSFRVHACVCVCEPARKRGRKEKKNSERNFSPLGKVSLFLGAQKGGISSEGENFHPPSSSSSSRNVSGTCRVMGHRERGGKGGRAT